MNMNSCTSKTCTSFLHNKTEKRWETFNSSSFTFLSRWGTSYPQGKEVGSMQRHSEARPKMPCWGWISLKLQLCKMCLSEFGNLSLVTGRCVTYTNYAQAPSLPRILSCSSGLTSKHMSSMARMAMDSSPQPADQKAAHDKQMLSQCSFVTVNAHSCKAVCLEKWGAKNSSDIKLALLDARSESLFDVITNPIPRIKHAVADAHSETIRQTAKQQNCGGKMAMSRSKLRN
jgi:hypothetical protein